MLRKLTELRVLKAIVDLSQDIDNTNTNKIHFINDTLFNALRSDEIDRFTKIFTSYPGFSEGYEATRPAKHDLEKLAKLPRNTLGYEYAKFMNDHNFIIDWYPPMEEKSILHYARNRMYQTHDILHTITGFHAGSFNEMALQGFYAGQEIPNATVLLTTAASTLNLLRENDPIKNSKFFDYLFAGYQIGKNAHKVIFYAWEDKFNEDIDGVRKELNIRAFKGTLPSFIY